MKLVKYESPINDTLPLELIERILGVNERLLETPQLDGTETKHNKDIAYLAKEGETVLGMVHATIPTVLPTLAGLSGVCTTPEARGKGIGKLLFGKIVEEIDSLGVKVAVLGTGNAIAAKMYSSFGFNYLPCSGVMIRLKDGGVVDFTRDFYTVKSFESAIPLFFDKGREITDSFYVEIAEGDSAKKAVLEPITKRIIKSTYHYGDADVPTLNTI